MRNWLRTRTEELVYVELPPRPVVRDVATIMALVAIAVLEFLFRDGGLETASFAVSLAAAAALWWRRPHPLLLLVAMAIPEFVIDVAIGFGDPEATTFFSSALAAIIVTYALARWAPLPHVAIGTGILWALQLAGAIQDDEGAVVLVLSPLPLFAVIAAGLVFRYRAALRRGSEARIRLTERNVLARELHDTVAHHISAIAVQAQAAQFVVDTDPEQAKQAMAAVERTATEAIDEMRRMVGVLRSDDDRARSVTADRLDGLADPTGAPAVVVHGDVALSSLPAGVAAAAYRITQEAITNARRHSRGVTSVRVDAELGADAFAIDVVNDGTPSTRNSGSGYGLVGMQERVDALDGELESGPTEPDGWRVRARLPLARGADA